MTQDHANSGATSTEAAHAAYRALPSVDALLREPALAAQAAQVGDAALLDAVRAVLAAARTAIGAGSPSPAPHQWPEQVAALLDARMRRSLQPVINATGVIIHTNLGRAPLSANALSAMAEVGQC